MRRAREEMWLSRIEVGRMVGRSAKTVQNWEGGVSRPSADDRRRLEEALGLERGRLTPVPFSGHRLEAYTARGVLLVDECVQALSPEHEELLARCRAWLGESDVGAIRAREQTRKFREGRVPASRWRPGDEPCAPEVEARIGQLVESHAIPERDLSGVEEAALWGRVPEQEQVSDEEWDEMVTEAEKQWT